LPGIEHKLSRRSFLKIGAVAALNGVFPSYSFSAFTGPFQPEKSVSLYNVHTGESVKAVYWSEGKYNNQALDDINYLLRDFRANSIQPINKQLLDFLHAIQTRLETRQYFHIVSGYRSSATNEFLRKNNKGVAKNSMHLYGKAVDFRVPKSGLALVRKAALDRGYGVGKVRSW
jgi:uncharacterized protein YcbK (DUF882 family)